MLYVLYIRELDSCDIVEAFLPSTTIHERRVFFQFLAMSLYVFLININNSHLFVSGGP